jgi:3-isopropylmalate dehydrogenase
MMDITKKHKIAWLEGDGIGHDVMEAAKLVLDAVNFNAEYLPGDVGWEFWCNEGNPLPDRTIELLKETDACLFGAITSKPKEEAEKELVTELKGKGLIYSSPIVRLRQVFDLYANMRPCKAYPGNPLNYKEGIDITVFRENTEGLYAGVEFHPVPNDLYDMLMNLNKKMAKFKDTSPDDLAISTRIFSRKGCQRITRKAFDYAKQFNKPSVTIVEKPNVLRETSGLQVREARKIHKEYPGIDMWETNVDAMVMWLVKNPEDYSVLVATNMFGDIVSDLSAQLVGGLGFASSANLGNDYALFEPTHGSAPKYAGEYISNPIAMIITARLMLEYLGEQEKADRIEKAITEVVQEGKVRTYDMEKRKATDKDKGKTLEVAKAIAEKASQ